MSNTEGNNTLNVLSNMFSPLRENGKFMLVNAYVCTKYGARNFAIFASTANTDKQAQVDVAIAIKRAMDSGDWSAFENNATVPAGQAGGAKEEQTKAATTPLKTPIVEVIPVAPEKTTEAVEKKEEPPAKKAKTKTPADNVIEMPKQPTAKKMPTSSDDHPQDPIHTLAEMLVGVMVESGLVKVNAAGQIDAIGPDDKRLRQIIDRVCFQAAKRAVRRELAHVLTHVAQELSADESVNEKAVNQ